MLAVLVFAVAGCNGEKGHSEGDPALGADVYDASCAGCHGAAGGGEAESGVVGAADLSEHVAETEDHHLEEVILDGVGEMPAIDLSEEELADVIAYLRQEFGAYTGDGDHDDE